MEKYKELLNCYLGLGLYEYFDIHNFIADFREESITDNELKSRVLLFIKYLLDKNIFEVGDLVNEGRTFAKYDLSNEEIIEKIKITFNEGINSINLWAFWFSLTPYGLQEAKNYLLKIIYTREKILINGATCNFLNLKSILDIVENEFKTYDIEEIIHEATYALFILLEEKFITLCIHEKNLDWEEVLFRLKRKTLRNEIENLLINKENLEDDKVFKCIVLPPSEALVEKWKECGGRLVNRWYKLIDQNYSSYEN